MPKYIEEKVEIWSSDTDASLTDRLTDSAPYKCKGGALVTQYVIDLRN